MLVESPYMTFYLMAIVTYSLSVTIYKISANKKKYQTFDHENECENQEGEKCVLHHLTENV